MVRDVFLSCQSSLIFLISWFDKVKRNAISLAKTSCLLSQKLSYHNIHIENHRLRIKLFKTLQRLPRTLISTPRFLTRAVNSVLLLKVDTKFGNTLVIKRQSEPACRLRKILHYLSRFALSLK